MNTRTRGLNDLDNGKILKHVLGYLAGHISFYSDTAVPNYDFSTYHYSLQNIIQYGLVSRRWMETMVPYICNTIYITSRPPNRLNLANIQSRNAHRLLKSNIKSVINMGGAHYAQHLHILYHHTGSLPTLNVLLDGYGFSRAAWPKLKDFILHGRFEFQTGLRKGKHVDMIYAYLSKLAPSLGNIYSGQRYMFDALDDRFTSHRRYLDTECAWHISATYFPRLTCLVLHNGFTRSDGYLIRFFASTLQELELWIGHDSSFTWRQFTDECSHIIEFKELTTFSIFCTLADTLPSPSAPRLLAFHGTQMILFPKLHTLKTTNAFNAYTNLTGMLMNIKLRLLDITEAPGYLLSLDPMLPLCTDKVIFQFWDMITLKHIPKLTGAMTQLFNAHADARHADIRITHLPGAKLNWPNLRTLKFVIKYVDWNLMEALLADLPHIKKLVVTCDTIFRYEPEFDVLSSEIRRYTPTSTSTISRSLEEFTYRNLTNTVDHDVSLFVEQLFLRSPSLIIIQACEECFEDILKLSTTRDIDLFTW